MNESPNNKRAARPFPFRMQVFDSSPSFARRPASASVLRMPKASTALSKVRPASAAPPRRTQLPIRHIFNDVAITAKNNAVGQAPQYWQSSLRRAPVRSLVQREMSFAPYSEFATLQPTPMGVGARRQPSERVLEAAPYAHSNAESQFGLGSERPRIRRPPLAPPLPPTNILGGPLVVYAAASGMVWDCEQGWVPRSIKRAKSASSTRRISSTAVGSGHSTGHERKLQGTSILWTGLAQAGNNMEWDF